MRDKGTECASIDIDADTLICSNRWTVRGVGPLRTSLDELMLPRGDVVSINGSAITAMDTAGAWLMLQLRERLETAGRQVVLDAFRPAHGRLVHYIADESQGAETVAPRRAASSFLERWFSICHDLVSFLAFTGEVIVSLLLAIRHPGRIRWREILADIYQSGVKALPIVGLLSFLMGVVIAYQGSVQLKLYGANIYIADLVGHSMLRELAPLLTAILVCGRTGSAYAAQIGTMKVREEVAALQTIGIPPVDVLVLPKLISLVVVLPLLSVFADVLAICGGMVMANSQLGISFSAFFFRLEDAISYSTFMIGIGKAPLFAAIIAIVGCYQGFRVEGSAESVGRHTTISVVQSIFLVIVTDALFSILFILLGV
ncbi:MAG: ABC transporter permease [Gammaproteobacteria bacterium]|nr:ABC transporter permease [Gammaproteobacteria bacterium]